MIKFDKIPYHSFSENNESISDSYVRSISHSKYHKIKITQKACKDSIYALSHLSKNEHKKV